MDKRINSITSEQNLFLLESKIKIYDLISHQVINKLFSFDAKDLTYNVAKHFTAF